MSGYLDQSYLDASYLSAVDEAVKPSQVTLVINQSEKVLSQAKLNLTGSSVFGSQVELAVRGAEKDFSSQVEKAVLGVKRTKAQVFRKIAQTGKENPSQVELKTSRAAFFCGEVRLGKIPFFLSTEKGYLAGAYLSQQYLTPFMGAELRSQVKVKTTFDHLTASQVELAIDDRPVARKAQVKGRITTSRSLMAQVNRVRESSIRSQATIALYNTDNLRILYNFQSRGNGINAGVNWTASSQMPGDFSVNNVNTDIVEQAWRSASGVKTGVSLLCDTGIPQGVFVDTMAILGHNLTTSAALQFQGSDSSDFSSVGFDQKITVKKKNAYWVSQDLPLQSYRYWRLLINDQTNPASYLQIGTILFGKSMIFQGECFVDEVSRSTKHFADKVETEGFTNVTVDRAVKYAVGLDFKNIAFEKGNYNRIRDFFDACRTGLKALWIPTPKFPDRFAVFGKLTQIPVEKHNVKGEGLDFVDFACEVDESL